MRYGVVLTPDDNDTVLVTVPDLPDAVTFGEDREDALARAVDAIETALMGRMADRETIPEPSFKATDHVELPALSVAKIAVYCAMRSEGVGKAALANAWAWRSRKSTDCWTSATTPASTRSNARSRRGAVR